jgi:C-terminal processing protease CtpA/Prc
MDKAIKAMLANLDPYGLFNEQDVVSLKSTIQVIYRVGVLTTKRDKLIIKEPYKSFNRQSGFKAGDEIIQIGDISDHRMMHPAITQGSKTQKLQ